MAALKKILSKRRIAALTLLALLLALAPKGWQRLRLTTGIKSARAALRGDDLPTATETLLALEHDFPQRAEIAYLLGVCHRRSGKIVQARQFFQEAGELGWSPKDLVRQHAMTEFQTDNHSAEPYLLELLKNDCPDEAAGEVYECLVKGYLAGLYLREAHLCLDHWIEWQPTASVPRMLRAELYHSVGEIARENDEYRELVRLHPDHRAARMRLGHALLEGRAADEAIEHFEHARRLAPDDPEPPLAIAACLRHLGKLPEARARLEEALAGELSASHRLFALVEMGQVALAERSYETAVDYLRQALELSSADRTAHYAMGLALSRLGRKEEANQHLDDSRRLDDQNMQLADLVHQIIQSPDDPAMRCEVGEILLDQGKHREAYIWLTSALRCDRRHPATHQALARYYSETGKQDAAEQHLAWAAQMGGRAQPAEPPH